MTTSFTLGMVGDLLVDRDDPIGAFADVRDLLRTPDLLFGNLEGPYSDSPQAAPSVGVMLAPKERNLDVFAKAGFKVLSMANNHMVDCGHAALLENRARLNAQGIATCGAGKNLASAREPAIVSVNGLRVAILAYASVFPMGYEARSNVPGIAPFRAYDLWRPAYDNYHIPGTPPRTTSVFDERDLTNLREDIAEARCHADLVITSFHWGDFLKPFHLTEHEKRTARVCIDLGADLVVGHHHHALRGMEWYRGKPIFYGLGHFVFDLRIELSDELRAAMEHMFAAQDSVDNYGIFPREGWPLLPLHPDTRMTLMAYAKADAKGFHDIGFVPCRLRPDGKVQALNPASAEGHEVVTYMGKCLQTQKLNARMDQGSALELGGYRAIRVTCDA